MDSLSGSRYWEQIINTMSDALVLISPEGRIILVNRAFEELTGYAADDVVGQPCSVLECDACRHHPRQDGSQRCALFDPGQEGMRRVRCTIARKNGTYLNTIKKASILKDENGRVLGAVETMSDITELERLDQKVESLSRKLTDGGDYHGIIGASAPIRKVIQLVDKAAQSDAPVMIYGESGTGKELVAEAIHERGVRRDGPFIKLNCAALNASLLESELFGHIKGAFTGAYRHRQGRFEAADGGDIFLDEIGDISESIQVKLLRVLENKQVERVGDHRPIRVDVRIISATNKNIADLITLKQFREDLFFRINVIPIQLPSLRERKEDIPLLAQHFIQRLRRLTGKPIAGLTQAALNHFMDYAWPGNIRELKSALEFAFVVAERGKLDIDHLPPQLGGAAKSCGPPAVGNPTEKEALVDALRRANGNQTQAARLLGVNRVTVWNRMRKYGIDLQRVLHV
jgi:two-component system, NtrC family, response regulator HydG